MKKLLSYILFVMLAISCNTNKNISASAIGLVNLENYAAKSAADLPYSYNYMVITNQFDFDAFFGINKSGNINITYPSFNGQTVVACVAQPSKNKITIRFEKAEFIGKEINIYCSTIESNEQLNNIAIPVAIATVPKVLNVTKVNFFTNGEKVLTKTVNFENKAVEVANEQAGEDAKPVVSKRTMRRPAVI